MDNKKQKNQFKLFILVLGLFLSLVLCSSASAADLNGVSHIKNSPLTSINELKSVHSNSTIIKTVKKSDVTKKVASTNFPAYYDLRKLGKLPPVELQGIDGTCWAFAALGSLESSLLPKQKYIFSANNMKNILSNRYPQGFDRNYNDEGCWDEATAYFTRYSGPVLSSQDPYNEYSSTSPTGLKPAIHVQNTIIIPARNSSGKMDNSQLKYVIMKYGAVYSLMRYSDSYFNYLTNGYYYNGQLEVNHAIDIVGWDDNYNKNNFLKTPPGNGAFIIRNSWGSYWGDKGYFYVSYYDKSLANTDDNVVFMGAEPTSNYDNIYQYDPFGYVENYGFGKNVGWFSNVFTAKGNEVLKASSFYVFKPNTSYELYVYLNPTGKNPESGKLVGVKKGIISTEGYKTIKLINAIPLIKNHKFSVVVKLLTPNYNKPITIEYPMSDYSSKATAKPGESYISSNGISWKDMTSVISKANVCLKAFTSGKSTNLLTKQIGKSITSYKNKVSSTIKVTNKAVVSSVIFDPILSKNKTMVILNSRIMSYTGFTQTFPIQKTRTVFTPPIFTLMIILGGIVNYKKK